MGFKIIYKDCLEEGTHKTLETFLFPQKHPLSYLPNAKPNGIIKMGICQEKYYSGYFLEITPKRRYYHLVPGKSYSKTTKERDILCCT